MCLILRLTKLTPINWWISLPRWNPPLVAINLEDIKSPECFVVEKKLRERMKIPVFHDDQHGTAIVAAAAVYNGLRIVGKKIEEVRLVASGGWCGEYCPVST